MISAATLRLLTEAGVTGEALACIVESIDADHQMLIDADISADISRRQRHAESQARYILRKKAADISVDQQSETPPETKVPTPLKTQPKETPSIEGGKKPPKIRTRIVPGWAPSEENLEYARRRGLLDADIRTETEKFRDHHLKTGSLFLDWNAAWRTWCQRVNEFAVKPRANGSHGYPQQSHPKHSFR